MSDTEIATRAELNQACADLEKELGRPLQDHEGDLDDSQYEEAILKSWRDGRVLTRKEVEELLGLKLPNDDKDDEQ